MVRQLSRQLARRRRRERITGAALAVLGIVVLVVALMALRSPNETSSVRAGSATTTLTPRTADVASSGAPTRPTTSSKPAPAATGEPIPSSTPSATASVTQPVRLPLVVLNNTTITGLAATARDRFEAGGWTVTTIGNLQNEIISTCAYYDPSVPNAESGALALQAQFPTIKRVVPKFPELPPGPIVVVLTPDYS